MIRVIWSDFFHITDMPMTLIFIQIVAETAANGYVFNLQCDSIK